MVTRTLACTVALVALAGVLPGADEEAVKKEVAALQGKWTIVSVEREGKVEENWKDGVREMDGTKYKLTPKTGTPVEGTFSVDPLGKVKAMDIKPSGGTYKGKTLKGIYSVEGDTLKICFAGDDAKDRPTEFAARPGYVLAVHKRAR